MKEKPCPQCGQDMRLPASINADKLAALEQERDQMRMVIECLISVIGNVNTADLLIPVAIQRLKDIGYSNLADDLALTGFARGV